MCWEKTQRGRMARRRRSDGVRKAYKSSIAHKWVGFGYRQGALLIKPTSQTVQPGKRGGVVEIKKLSGSLSKNPKGKGRAVNSGGNHIIKRSSLTNPKQTRHTIKKREINTRFKVKERDGRTKPKGIGQ